VQKPAVVLFAVALSLAGAAGSACGPTPFQYEGVAGQPVPADFGRSGLADITVHVNGGEAHVVTVDTGAPTTIFDSTRFPNHTDGTHIDDIAAFDLVFPGVVVVSYRTFSDTDGVIGGDILHHFAFTLDYEGNRVWLSDPFDPAKVPADVNAGREVQIPFMLRGGGLGKVGSCGACGSMEYAATRILVHAAFEGATPVWVLVDTGASGVILSGDMFASLTLDPDRPKLDGVNLVAINDGNQASFITRVSRIELQGVAGTDTLPTDDVVVFVIPGTGLLDSLTAEVHLPTKALMGATLLDHYLTTVDYQSAALRFRQYDDVDTRNPGEWLGPGFQMDLENGAWTVTECYTNKDAYMKGLRSGDVVEQIGNMPLTGQTSADTVHQIWTSYRVGDMMPVTFVMDGAMTTVDVLVEDLLPHYPPS
jgi:hypothetical protein